jgi:hypothetical protein
MIEIQLTEEHALVLQVRGHSDASLEVVTCESFLLDLLRPDFVIQLHRTSVDVVINLLIVVENDYIAYAQATLPALSLECLHYGLSLSCGLESILGCQ